MVAGAGNVTLHCDVAWQAQYQCDIWWQAQSIVASSIWPLCWPFYRQIHSLRRSYIFTLRHFRHVKVICGSVGAWLLVAGAGNVTLHCDVAWQAQYQCDIWWQAQSIVASSIWPLCWPFYRQIHSLRSSFFLTLRHFRHVKVICGSVGAWLLVAGAGNVTLHCDVEWQAQYQCDIWWQAQSIVASSIWPLCWPFYRQIHSLRSSFFFDLMTFPPCKSNMW